MYSPVQSVQSPIAVVRTWRILLAWPPPRSREQERNKGTKKKKKNYGISGTSSLVDINMKELKSSSIAGIDTPCHHSYKAVE